MGVVLRQAWRKSQWTVLMGYLTICHQTHYRWQVFRTTLSGWIFATIRHVSTVGKNLLNSNTSTCPDNIVNFGPVAAEIGSGVLGTPANFNGFRVLSASLHGTLVVGDSQTCGVDQRAPPIFGRAAITLGIGPHSSICIVKNNMGKLSVDVIRLSFHSSWWLLLSRKPSHHLRLPRVDTAVVRVAVVV